MYYRMSVCVHTPCVQGEVVHWLACSLYAACRKGSTPTVGKGLMEGNCVSLTRILRTAKLRSIHDMTMSSQSPNLHPLAATPLGLCVQR